MHNIERLQNYLSPGVAKNLVLLGNDGTGKARRQWPMDVLPMSRGVSGSVRLHILSGASNMAGSESAGEVYSHSIVRYGTQGRSAVTVGAAVAVLGMKLSSDAQAALRQL